MSRVEEGVAELAVALASPLSTPESSLRAISTFKDMVLVSNPMEVFDILHSKPHTIEALLFQRDEMVRTAIIEVIGEMGVCAGLSPFAAWVVARVGACRPELQLSWLTTLLASVSSIPPNVLRRSSSNVCASVVKFLQEFAQNPGLIPATLGILEQLSSKSPDEFGAHFSSLISLVLGWLLEPHVPPPVRDEALERFDAFRVQFLGDLPLCLRLLNQVAKGLDSAPDTALSRPSVLRCLALLSCLRALVRMRPQLSVAILRVGAVVQGMLRALTALRAAGDPHMLARLLQDIHTTLPSLADVVQGDFGTSTPALMHLLVSLGQPPEDDTLWVAGSVAAEWITVVSGLLATTGEKCDHNSATCLVESQAMARRLLSPQPSVVASAVRLLVVMLRAGVGFQTAVIVKLCDYLEHTTDEGEPEKRRLGLAALAAVHGLGATPLPPTQAAGLANKIRPLLPSNASDHSDPIVSHAAWRALTVLAITTPPADTIGVWVSAAIVMVQSRMADKVVSVCGALLNLAPSLGEDEARQAVAPLVLSLVDCLYTARDVAVVVCVSRTLHRLVMMHWISQQAVHRIQRATMIGLRSTLHPALTPPLVALLAATHSVHPGPHLTYASLTPHCTVGGPSVPGEPAPHTLLHLRVLLDLLCRPPTSPPLSPLEFSAALAPIKSAPQPLSMDSVLETAANHCAELLVTNRLSSHYGSPRHTLTRLEKTLLDHVAVAGESIEAARALLALLFAIQRHVASALGSSATLPHPPSDSAATRFFLANSRVCEEWFARVQMLSLQLSARSGLPYHTLHYVSQFLLQCRNSGVSSAADTSNLAIALVELDMTCALTPDIDCWGIIAPVVEGFGSVVPVCIHRFIEGCTARHRGHLEDSLHVFKALALENSQDTSDGTEIPAKEVLLVQDQSIPSPRPSAPTSPSPGERLRSPQEIIAVRARESFVEVCSELEDWTSLREFEGYRGGGSLAWPIGPEAIHKLMQSDCPAERSAPTPTASLLSEPREAVGAMVLDSPHSPLQLALQSLTVTRYPLVADVLVDIVVSKLASRNNTQAPPLTPSPRFAPRQSLLMLGLKTHLSLCGGGQKQTIVHAAETRNFSLVSRLESQSSLSPLEEAVMKLYGRGDEVDPTTELTTRVLEKLDAVPNEHIDVMASWISHCSHGTALDPQTHLSQLKRLRDVHPGSCGVAALLAEHLVGRVSVPAHSSLRHAAVRYASEYGEGLGLAPSSIGAIHAHTIEALLCLAAQKTDPPSHLLRQTFPSASQDAIDGFDWLAGECDAAGCGMPGEAAGAWAVYLRLVWAGTGEHSSIRLAFGAEDELPLTGQHTRASSTAIQAVLAILDMAVTYAGVAEVAPDVLVALEATPCLAWSVVPEQLIAAVAHTLDWNCEVSGKLLSIAQELCRECPSTMVHLVLPQSLQAHGLPADPVYPRLLDTLHSAHPETVLTHRRFYEEISGLAQLPEERLALQISRTLQGMDAALRLLEAERDAIEAAGSEEGQRAHEVLMDRYGKAVHAHMTPLLEMLDMATAPTAQHRTLRPFLAARMRAACDIALHPPRGEPFPRALLPLKAMNRELRESWRHKRLRLSSVAPALAKHDMSIAVPGTPERVVGVEETVFVLGTKTKPKRIVAVGESGRGYTYLLKGKDDVHLDARVLQAMELTNRLLLEQGAVSDTGVRIRGYAVVPVGCGAGLIRFVDDVSSMYSLYRRNLIHRHTATESTGSPAKAPAALRPIDHFFSKLLPKLRQLGISTGAPRSAWPADVQHEVFMDMCADTSDRLLANELLCSSPSPEQFTRRTASLARSVAVMSMLGHVLGIGDRHLENILIDWQSAEAVHIDFNISFDQGLALRVPECVPFRLTRNLEAAFGITGVHGHFMDTAVRLLDCLCGQQLLFGNFLDTLVWDGGVVWESAQRASKVGDLEREGALELAPTNILDALAAVLPLPLGDVLPVVLDTLAYVASLHQELSVADRHCEEVRWTRQSLAERSRELSSERSELEQQCAEGESKRAVLLESVREMVVRSQDVVEWEHIWSVRMSTLSSLRDSRPEKLEVKAFSVGHVSKKGELVKAHDHYNTCILHHVLNYRELLAHLPPDFTSPDPSHPLTRLSHAIAQTQQLCHLVGLGQPAPPLSTDMLQGDAVADTDMIRSTWYRLLAHQSSAQAMADALPIPQIPPHKSGGVLSKVQATLQHERFRNPREADLLVAIKANAVRIVGSLLHLHHLYCVQSHASPPLLAGLEQTRKLVGCSEILADLQILGIGYPLPEPPPPDGARLLSACGPCLDLVADIHTLCSASLAPQAHWEWGEGESAVARDLLDILRDLSRQEKELAERYWAVLQGVLQGSDLADAQAQAQSIDAEFCALTNVLRQRLPPPQADESAGVPGLCSAVILRLDNLSAAHASMLALVQSERDQAVHSLSSRIVFVARASFVLQLLEVVMGCDVGKDEAEDEEDEEDADAEEGVDECERVSQQWNQLLKEVERLVVAITIRAILPITVHVLQSAFQLSPNRQFVQISLTAPSAYHFAATGLPVPPQCPQFFDWLRPEVALESESLIVPAWRARLLQTWVSPAKLVSSYRVFVHEWRHVTCLGETAGWKTQQQMIAELRAAIHEKGAMLSQLEGHVRQERMAHTAQLTHIAQVIIDFETQRAPTSTDPAIDAVIEEIVGISQELYQVHSDMMGLVERVSSVLAEQEHTHLEAAVAQRMEADGLQRAELARRTLHDGLQTCNWELVANGARGWVETQQSEMLGQVGGLLHTVAALASSTGPEKHGSGEFEGEEEIAAPDLEMAGAEGLRSIASEAKRLGRQCADLIKVMDSLTEVLGDRDTPGPAVALEAVAALPTQEVSAVRGIVSGLVPAIASLVENLQQLLAQTKGSQARNTAPQQTYMCGLNVLAMASVHRSKLKIAGQWVLPPPGSVPPPVTPSLADILTTTHTSTPTVTSTQVAQLINAAKAPENLSRMYEGWTPWL